MPTFDDFSDQRIDCGAVRLRVRRAGTGAPVVLLHGYPQTGRAWERVAPALAERFDVIVPDLRGYGGSDAPQDDAAHETYAKRTMARDVAGLLDALGVETAHVIGHDRGGRVAYRMALDLGHRLRSLTVIEIVPTLTFWEAWSADVGHAAYHWTFLAQAHPLPETLIGADPVAYCDHTLGSWTRGGTLAPFSEAALAEYRAQLAEPAHRSALCADYRAGYHVDRRLDAEDRDAGRKIAVPTLVIHGNHGFPARTGDPGGIWRDWATDVTVREVEAGHFAMEEAPEATLAALMDFLPD